MSERAGAHLAKALILALAELKEKMPEDENLTTEGYLEAVKTMIVDLNDELKKEPREISQSSLDFIESDKIL
jgi:hypothetical protein